jgi:hypothetical protein
MCYRKTRALATAGNNVQQICTQQISLGAMSAIRRAEWTRPVTIRRSRQHWSDSKPHAFLQQRKLEFYPGSPDLFIQEAPWGGRAHIKKDGTIAGRIDFPFGVRMKAPR